MTPEMTIVNVSLQTMIAGSQGDYTMSNAFGGDAEDGEVGESRSFSLWDDEE